MVGGGGGMLPKLVTGRSFAFAFASTTLSIVNIAWPAILPTMEIYFSFTLVTR